VPTILFGVGTGELLSLMATAGSDVIGVDWRVPLDVARPASARTMPCRATWTRRSACRPLAGGREAARQVLADGAADGSGTGHIFNLGHGVLPEADIGILGAVVDLVHAESAGT
jgi:uroporphyrinogen decarboxylase